MNAPIARGFGIRTPDIQSPPQVPAKIPLGGQRHAGLGRQAGPQSPLNGRVSVAPMNMNRASLPSPGMRVAHRDPEQKMHMPMATRPQIAMKLEQEASRYGAPHSAPPRLQSSPEQMSHQMMWAQKPQAPVHQQSHNNAHVRPPLSQKASVTAQHRIPDHRPASAASTARPARPTSAPTQQAAPQAETKFSFRSAISDFWKGAMYGGRGSRGANEGYSNGGGVASSANHAYGGGDFKG